MTAYRTRGQKMAGQKMPSFTTLICDFRQPNGDGCPESTPRRGDSAVGLRRQARELGWVRVEGKDYCPAHVCPHGYVPGDHHYDSGSCANRTPESDALERAAILRGREQRPMKPCPYHSTLDNGMRLYGPKHACFTVYDESRPSVPAGEAGA